MNTNFIQQIISAKKGISLPSFLIAKTLKATKCPSVVVGLERDLEDLAKFSELVGLTLNKLPTIYDYVSASDDEKKKVTAFLIFLLTKKKHDQHLLIPAELFSIPFPTPQAIQKNTLSITVNEPIDVFKVTRTLVEMQYTRESKSIEIGSIASRGDILEVFPPGLDSPIRIETDFGIVKAIYSFDPKNQEKGDALKRVQIPPMFVESADGKLEEYVSLALGFNDCDLVEIDTEGIREAIDPLEDGSINMYKNATRTAKRHLYFQPFDEDITPTSDDLISYHSNKEVFFEQFKKNAHFTKIVLTRSPEKIEPLFENAGLETSTILPADINKAFEAKEKSVIIIDARPLKAKTFPKGFIDIGAEVILATDKNLIQQKIQQVRTEVDETFIASLKPGDFVVHIDHGIGRFSEIVKRPIDEGVREFFLIEYAKGDKVYLPVEYADKIAKYVGEAAPKINRLHEVNFASVKKKIKEDAAKVAQELIDTQALRELHEGFPFKKNEEDEARFMENFPFEDTECQAFAWKEVQADLESDQPMDRLLCGDVGFGKTEVAMRAAFRVVTNGRQVGVLAPTTILAKQHYENFKKRFAGFSYNIELISRLQSPKEQKQLVEKLETGKIDVIIGTHRLISADISFEDLGLIVVDEEQRFGVKAKEALKRLRSKADILTLTATPIPRTLHMSLSGLKQISTLTTPPEGRVPVKTIISKRNDDVIKNAIEKELEKGGQVFFLHNRVRTIEVAKRKLEELVPDATMDVVHGQLDPRRISKTMNAFEKGHINVLVTSSIIENGVDIPNVNTLIVADATRFGLGQLYQLRGRIGRSNKKGFAYFLYNNQSLGGPAKERLKALLAAKKLGSGFEIAMKDLEIRGAGNILGKEQSGRVKTLGLSHYLKLLNQAIREAQTGEKIKELDVSIDLPINAFIPEELVESEEEKLTLYQRLANIETLEKLNSKEKELTEGVDSEEFENLFYILKLKLEARKADIKNIDTKIYQNQDGSNFKKFVITFDTKTDYKKAYEALKKFHYIEVEEKSIKMTMSDMGRSWKDHLQEIISFFKPK